ncbi:MAG: tail fiber domain-containing protein [Candidatus Peribacteria bacterium]|nr:MAG: tail fiber domain-containing protein [Candidatus Peribacteria bacterium]
MRFDWKKDGTPSLGFIAQEVEQVLPELVSHSGEYEAVQYGNITAILVEAVKEQQQQIKKLQEEITSLKAQL